MNELNALDYSIFLAYFVVVMGYGYWVYQQKKKKEASTTDFFLAEGTLTWWAIGASLIASNISAEQFIGMSGSGCFLGVAIACYEWFAAIALIIVAVFFMPVYLKNHIYTMPQFLRTRYNETVAAIMTVFWLFLYVFVNLTSILYLGAIAIDELVGNTLDGFVGDNSLQAIMVLMAIFATIITIGGMKVIGYTDVIQVVVLVIGGLATTYLSLTLVSNHFGQGYDAWLGWKLLMEKAPDHFHMIIPTPGEGASETDVKKYLELPGIAMYIASMWIVNLNYWGCNQYITQRALGADLQTARKGILFAGFLKLMMPVIVMLPGIAAYVLYQNGALQEEMLNSEGNFSNDKAYPAILTFLPNGLKGLAMAALTAAIVASLAGKLNSISTIFTLDVYKRYINPKASEGLLVWIGRLIILIAICIAVALTWQDTLGIGGEGGFTFIQKYTGYISPGVFAMFLMGMFWKRTTGAAAVVGVLLGFALSVFFDQFAPAVLGPETFMYKAFQTGVTEAGAPILKIPFLIWMGWNFFYTALAMVLVSLFGPQDQHQALEVDASMFKVTPVIGVQIAATFMILGALYAYFW